MSVPLSTATLAHHAARVRVPAYDRAALAPGVAHISVGSFHRAHQAVFFDDLAGRGHTDWGIVGVGLRRSHMREALEPQDGLYTVVQRGARGDRARVVGAITRYLFAPEETAAVVGALADPRLRLVTLTVTGAGYGPGDAPAIDLLVGALARRRAAGLPPFTVLSCDNLPENGRLARDAVLRAADPGLAAWIAETGAFPSSMVDRITPRTSPEDRAWIARTFGVDDRWPVVTEPFSQWIVEDRFCAGRPPLDEVGVRFVDDVAPYALMKTRLLNASHCALGHLGALAGYEHAHEAMGDPALRGVLTTLMAEEVSPLLPAVPGVDLAAYRASVLERLANPVLADRLARLRRNGSDKMPTHVLSSLALARERRGPHAVLTLAVAAWIEALRRFEVEDPRAEELRALAAEPRAFVARSGLFGALAHDAAWVAELDRAVSALRGGAAPAMLAA